jgi:SWI/SNF related-matrix-associated actin-dependent regulator of chromatin subfamily C
MTKLPCALFRDFSSDGALYHIFKVAYKMKSPSEWKVLDFSAPENFDVICRLLKEIEFTLSQVKVFILDLTSISPLQTKLLKWPVVFFATGIPREVCEDLASIVLAHSGKIASSAQEATHRIEWDKDVDGAGQSLTDEFFRPLDLRPHDGEGSAFVHWWYYPDSYDEWIPSQEVEARDLPDDPSAPGTAKKQWRVCCRFIRDVSTFNEWGNELDYEMEESIESADVSEGLHHSGEGKKSTRGKRKLDTGRKAQDSTETTSITQKMMTDAPPPTNDPLLASVSVVDVSGQSQCESKNENPLLTAEEVDRKRRLASTSLELDEIHFQKQKKRALLEPDPSRTTPSWFSRDSISSVERRYLPDIFLPDGLPLQERCEIGGNWTLINSEGSSADYKVSVKYITTRNYIIDQYSQTPQLYLSSTECRQKIAGDVAYIMRVHEFLDVFGLINNSSSIKAHARPPRSSAFYTACPSLSDIALHNATMRNDEIATSPATSSSFQWNNVLDEALLAEIVANSELSGGEIDWTQVSLRVGAHGSSPSPTARDCFTRFIGKSLTCPGMALGIEFTIYSYSLDHIHQVLRLMLNRIVLAKRSFLAEDQTLPCLIGQNLFLRSSLKNVPN